MHLHNDAHSHAHEHTHENGHTHTHEHTHAHGHEHDHHHHHHDHEGTPLEELLAMLKYMVGHNASHVRETEELAQQLKDTYPAEYDKIASAVAEFEKGNALLQEALDSLKK